MKKIKLYRHIIRHIEYLPPRLGKDQDSIITYDQTGWTSVANRVPGPDRAVVSTEVKEVEVSDKCLRRKR